MARKARKARKAVGKEENDYNFGYDGNKAGCFIPSRHVSVERNIKDLTQLGHSH